MRACGPWATRSIKTGRRPRCRAARPGRAARRVPRAGGRERPGRAVRPRRPGRATRRARRADPRAQRPRSRRRSEPHRPASARGTLDPQADHGFALATHEPVLGQGFRPAVCVGDRPSRAAMRLARAGRRATGRGRRPAGGDEDGDASRASTTRAHRTAVVVEARRSTAASTGRTPLGTWPPSNSTRSGGSPSPPNRIGSIRRCGTAGAASRRSWLEGRARIRRVGRARLPRAATRSAAPPTAANRARPPARPATRVQSASREGLPTRRPGPAARQESERRAGHRPERHRDPERRDRPR